METSAILSFFIDIIGLGFIFGLNSIFLYTGLFGAYIIALNKCWKKAFHLVVFLFLGRMLVILFLSGLSIIINAQSFVFYFYESFFPKLVSFILVLILIILGICFLKYPKITKLVEKSEYVLFFILGILFGFSSNVILKVFFSDIMINISNKFLGIFCGLIFSSVSFINILFIFVFIFGYFFNKIFLAFPDLNNRMQKISGFILIGLGIYQLFQIF